MIRKELYRIIYLIYQLQKKFSKNIFILLFYLDQRRFFFYFFLFLYIKKVMNNLEQN